MEMINVPPNVMEQLLQNAEDYALTMMMTATLEQIENVRKQNELFGRGLEICPNCNRESKLELENCEFCEQDKIPF
ncbi:MAG TPA: hypothetical protein PKY82_01590 [Pyrinomonadaceae bacterium]|nr:hypothetical protein [Pyrinomonadaceae bacterium]